MNWKRREGRAIVTVRYGRACSLTEVATDCMIGNCDKVNKTAWQLPIPRLFHGWVLPAIQLQITNGY